MSRIAAQEKLFQTTQTAGMSYSTAVQSTCGTIAKPPSPQIATQGRSGAASLAPRMPAGPKPMPEKPQVLSMVCGLRASQNCMNQLWWTPESSEMMASSGSTRRQSATIRSGRNGEVWSSKFGAVCASQAARQPAISACHSARSAVMPRRSISESSWRRKVRASARMPRVGG